MSKCQRALNDDSCLILVAWPVGWSSVAPGTDGNSTPTAARSPNAFCFAAGASQAALCVPMRGVGLRAGGLWRRETRRGDTKACMGGVHANATWRLGCLCARVSVRSLRGILAWRSMRPASLRPRQSRRAGKQTRCLHATSSQVATGNKQLPPSLPDQWHATAQCYQIWEICIRGKQD